MHLSDNLPKLPKVALTTHGPDQEPHMYDNLLPKSSKLSNTSRDKLNLKSSAIFPSPLTSSNWDGNLLAMELRQLFRTDAVFDEISNDDDFIEEICSLAHYRFYRDGDTIMREGELAKAMFFIIKGSVVVGSDDFETVFAELSAPSFCKYLEIIFILFSWRIWIDTSRFVFLDFLTRYTSPSNDHRASCISLCSGRFRL